MNIVIACDVKVFCVYIQITLVLADLKLLKQSWRLKRWLSEYKHVLFLKET